MSMPIDYPTLIYSAFLCYGMAVAVALILPRRNTLAQLCIVAGGLLGSVAAIAFACTHATGGDTLLLLDGAFRLHFSSAFFFALVSAGICITSVFAIGYLPRYAHIYSLREVNIASALFAASMCAVVASNMPVVFLVSWEVMSLAAYFLVIADRTDDSLYAGFLYFVMTQIGFFALLTGFILLSHGALFTTWADMSVRMEKLSPNALMAAFFLLFAGFGSKAGLVPLHQWLPYAHPQAPSHSSALLSGAMLSVALFSFLEVVRMMPVIPITWAIAVIATGLISAVFGSIHAAVENDGKRLLAWSSIEHMGLLFSAVGIVAALHAFGANSFTVVFERAMLLFIFFHAANHLFFKVGLFMSIGAIASETHTRDLDLMGGFARSWPVFSGFVLVLVLAAAALPPFGVFFGEWVYVQTLALAFANLPPIIAVSAAMILAIVALVAGLALFASVKMFSVIFLGRPRTEHAEDVQPLPLTMTAPIAVCAVLAAFSGLALAPLISPSAYAPYLAIMRGAVVSPLYLATLVFLAFGLVTIVWYMNRRSMRITGTWDCGTPLTPRMQYTATGFSAPVRFFFRMFLIADKQVVTTSISSENKWIARRTLVWNIRSIWEHWLYQHIGRYFLAVAHFVRRLQNGVVQLYLLLVVLTLLLTIAIAV